MVKKLQKSRLLKSSHTELKESVKDSAQQIWQAGLGAFARAQEEGTKAFESLVQEGVSMQRKTQAVAEEKITEASNKVSSMASNLTSKASGQWDKLENIFEERVAKALNRLGVPSAKDVSALMLRIDELNTAVQRLTEQAASNAQPSATVPTTATTAATSTRPRSTAARKTTRKTATPSDDANTP